MYILSIKKSKTVGSHFFFFLNKVLKSEKNLELVCFLIFDVALPTPVYTYI